MYGATPTRDHPMSGSAFLLYAFIALWVGALAYLWGKALRGYLGAMWDLATHIYRDLRAMLSHGSS